MSPKLLQPLPVLPDRIKHTAKVQLGDRMDITGIIKDLCQYAVEVDQYLNAKEHKDGD